MTTNDADPANQTTRDAPPIDPDVDNLMIAANQPGIDPCDVACEAMPGYIVGDLASPDQDWLLDHTDDCAYCANMLSGYERLDNVLDALDEETQGVAPPVCCVRERAARYGTVDSAVGPLRVAVTDEGVCEIGFAVNESEAQFRDRLRGRGLAPVADADAVAPVTTQLADYFHGCRRRFDVPLDFAGVTPFTRSVLEATAQVPFGQLSTYRQIADKVGSPRATRAVGNALGRNPIPVIVPCHRIVRSDATLGGYTGGTAIKERLLSLEGITEKQPTGVVSRLQPASSLQPRA